MVSDKEFFSIQECNAKRHQPVLAAGRAQPATSVTARVVNIFVTQGDRARTEGVPPSLQARTTTVRGVQKDSSGMVSRMKNQTKWFSSKITFIF